MLREEKYLTLLITRINRGKYFYSLLFFFVTIDPVNHEASPESRQKKETRVSQRDKKEERERESKRGLKLSSYIHTLALEKVLELDSTCFSVFFTPTDKDLLLLINAFQSPCTRLQICRPNFISISPTNPVTLSIFLFHSISPCVTIELLPLFSFLSLHSIHYAIFKKVSTLTETNVTC